MSKEGSFMMLWSVREPYEIQHQRSTPQASQASELGS